MEIASAARHNINEYKSRDAIFDNFVEGEDGKLYHLGKQEDGETVRQLYVQATMRGRLLVSKHGSETSGHRLADETLTKLKKTYYWASMRRDVTNWISGDARKKSERRSGREDRV